MGNLQGVNPKLRRRLETRDKAMSGDLVLALTPATAGSSAATITSDIASDDKYVRTVLVELQTSTGKIHDWFDGTFAVSGSIVTAGTGTAPTATTTVTLVNGVGTIDQEYVGVWAATDTATVTATGGTKLGYAITNKTSVDTVIA